MKRLTLFTVWGLYIAMFSLSLAASSNLALSENPPLVPIDMRRPGFWIARHPAPDSLFMSPLEITNLNRKMNRKGFVGQIEQSSAIINGANLKKQINDCYYMAKGSGKYLPNGEKPSPAFWQAMKQTLNVNKIKPVQQVRFAFPIRFTNQRLIPYSGILTGESLNPEFDQMQNSGFDIADALVLYHDSADGKWAFGAGRASSGWFWKEDLTIKNRVEWLNYLQAKRFVICTQNKTDIYQDAARTRYIGLARLGSSFPVVSEQALVYGIRMPDESTAYIARRDVHEGFLPYNARNVYELAFSTLNSPYGWGDLNAEYDCSGLIKQIFKCFGIYLPRNGAAQNSAVKLLHEFNPAENAAERERTITEKALPAQSFLRMPGHIMLYLGSMEGKAYALHALWGIGRPTPEGEDETIAANKVLISDLSLGEGSKRKSLLLRLSAIGAVANDR
jgi:hypothetical protein